MQFMLITGDPDLAAIAQDAGIDRVFVDLETEGKRERQAGIDAHFAGHAPADIATVRRAAPETTILVRCNPFSARSRAEVEAALECGADMLMLPMFRSVEEVEGFARIVGGRVPVVGLVETPAALARLRLILESPFRPDEVHLGLNDLSLLCGLDFLMEPVAGGLADHFCQEARRASVPYGFGGVGLVGTGAVPADLVLSEHVRLGSTRVILSRAFRDPVLAEPPGPERAARLRREITRLRHRLEALKEVDEAQLEENRRSFVEAVARAADRTGAMRA